MTKNTQKIKKRLWENLDDYATCGAIWDDSEPPIPIL